jgi:YhcH/YjgK/YiaL family protein
MPGCEKMIFDTLTRLSHYADLNKQIAWSTKNLKEYVDKEPGRYEIDGDCLFVIVQDYTTKCLSDCQWEAHRKYIDIQYVAQGIERIGYAPTSLLNITTPYNEDKDVEFLEGKGNLIECGPGSFMIFFPNEPHMPGVNAECCNSVRKIIVKIKTKEGICQ